VEEPGPEVLHDHVRFLRQLRKEPAPTLRFEVQGQAALVAVEAKEVAALDLALVVLDHGRRAAGRVAALGSLDLEHARTLVGEHHRAVRAGDLYLKREDPNPIERFAHLKTKAIISAALNGH